MSKQDDFKPALQSTDVLEPIEQSNGCDLNRNPASTLVQSLRAGLGLSLFALLICGFLYSSAVTGLGQVLFPSQSNGSVLFAHGQPVGSKLLAQAFVSDQYFYARPSASNYSVIHSAGSNMAITNPKLHSLIEQRQQAVMHREQVGAAQVPSDLVTASGSGLDPEISLQAAKIQIPRIARSRQLSEAQVNAVLQQHLRSKLWGIYGEEGVNVLALNLALDQLTQ